MTIDQFIYKYAKGVAYRLGRGDRHELTMDLVQEGFLAYLKCPSHYVEAQCKVAIRYSIMNAMSRWRWEVNYHGKSYVPRNDPVETENADDFSNEMYNPEKWASGRETARRLVSAYGNNEPDTQAFERLASVASQPDQQLYQTKRYRRLKEGVER